MTTKVEMHIAIHEPTKELIGIDKARKGKNCDCRCCSCKGELVAKKGELNQWHFAHFHNSKKECEYSFWVVCRDLAKQIFLSKETTLTSIWLSNEIGDIGISDISFAETKIDDVVFDVSFLTGKYGRVYVYFVTPETNRHTFAFFKDTTFSENVFAINLSSLDHQKEKVSKILKQIIVEGFNVKQFLDKRKKRIVQTAPANHYVPVFSLFDEIEEEERAQKKALEIPKNKPDLSMYDPQEFITMLCNPKLEINIKKLSSKDLESIYSLASTFLSFIKHCGYDENKHYSFTQIDCNHIAMFISYRERFVMSIVLDLKYVLVVPKNRTLVPVLSTHFSDSVARKVRESMLV